MKTILLLTLLAIFVGGCKRQKDNTAEQMLKEFYTQYITGCSEDNADAVAEAKENFLTRELKIKLAETELDYDPFLNAQDCDSTWLKTLEINPVQGSGMDDTYRICYDGGDTICLTLFLVQRDGKWLINDIEGLSDNSLEEPQHNNVEQKYLITNYAVDIFIIGKEIPYYSDKYSITKRIETREEEGEKFDVPVYTVSENGQNILSLETKYDYDTEQFTEQIGDIYILNDRFKTAGNIGLHSTIEDFMTAYPDFVIWYSYINDWYVIETKQFNFIQFFLDGNDFIKEGGPEFDSDREILQPSEFKKGSRIKAIRIWGTL